MAEVFISYSRKDKDFVRSLHDALAKINRDTWVDWEGIPPTAEWMKEIYSGIESADTFIFIISSDSVDSEICGLEIAHAVKHNKRLVPIVRRDVDAKAVPRFLGALNWIFFRESDDFDSAFQSLIKALDTDLEYVRGHTRLLTRAIEWDTEKRDNSFVLRGSDLQEAEGWLVQGTEKEPKPTPLQTQYVFASRKAETKRQRITLGAITFGFIVAVVLAAVAFYQRREAVAQRNVAEDRRQEAERRRFVSLSQSLTAQALLQQNQGNRDERAALLARQAYIFNQRYKGHVLAQVDNALRTVMSAHYSTPVLNEDQLGVNSIAFSPDGKTLASGSLDNTVRLWDLSNSPAEPIVLRGNKYRIRSVAFSPDGRTLAGNDDRDVRLWDPANPGGEPKVLQGHEGEITSVTFSPDGSTLASGSLDFSVRLWDLTNLSAEPIVLRGHKYGVSSVAFSPDGKTLASGSYDKTLLIWIAKTEILVDLVCKKARNSLSLDDWNRFVGDDLPYEPTCPNRSLHPSLILAAEDLARSGDTDGAVGIFKRALELDPDLVLDPKKEAKKFAAEGLVIKGNNIARGGDVEGAVAVFQKALELDPGLKIDPKAEAKPLAVSGLVEKGKNLAIYGNLDGAISLFRKAKELDPTLNLDPEAEAKKLAAPGPRSGCEGRAAGRTG